MLKGAASRAERKALQWELQEELHEKGVALEDIERLETHMRRLAIRCVELQEQRDRLKPERDSLIAERNCRNIVHNAVLAERNSLAEELLLVRANIAAQAAAFGVELGLLQEKWQAATDSEAALAAEIESLTNDVTAARNNSTEQAAGFQEESHLLREKWQAATADKAALQAEVEELEDKLAALAAESEALTNDLIHARADTNAQAAASAEQARLLEHRCQLAIVREAASAAENGELAKKLSLVEKGRDSCLERLRLLEEKWQSSVANGALIVAEKLEVEDKLALLVRDLESEKQQRCCSLENEALVVTERNHLQLKAAALLTDNKHQKEQIQMLDFEMNQLFAGKEAAERRVALLEEALARAGISEQETECSQYKSEPKEEEKEEEPEKKLLPCALCGTETHKMCAACGQAYYCSKVCQVTHYKEHKAECLIFQGQHTAAKSED